MRNTKVCSPIAFLFVFILLSPAILASSTDSKLAKIIVQKKSGFPTADFSANVSNGNDPFSEQFTNISQNIPKEIEIEQMIICTSILKVQVDMPTLGQHIVEYRQTSGRSCR